MLVSFNGFLRGVVNCAFACLLLSGTAYADYCLKFTDDQAVNNVSQFKKTYRIDSSSIVYSSSFDLDGDGRLEYFYYVAEVGGVYCGNISSQIGSCNLNIVQFEPRGHFVFLDDGVVFPGAGFDPKKNLKNFVCIRSEHNNGNEVFLRYWWIKGSTEKVIWPHM